MDYGFVQTEYDGHITKESSSGQALILFSHFRNHNEKTNIRWPDISLFLYLAGTALDLLHLVCEQVCVATGKALVFELNRKILQGSVLGATWTKLGHSETHFPSVCQEFPSQKLFQPVDSAN